MRALHIEVALSKLHPGRENPRRVKPKAEAHQRLIASIRSFGLIEPLIVRPMPDAKGEFRIIAGNRRLAALRQIHKQSKLEPKIRCEVRDVDDATAEALALTENFVREDMHPLDEAETFARLATENGSDVVGISASFGVTERYVRQRMKLAGLAKVVKTALRQDEIDIGTAEAFASVPEDRQVTIWGQLNGHPRHAEHVRNIIHHEWIDARHALFDLSVLPESVVSSDLFSERVLVERSVFMAAQLDALAAEKVALTESGWREVVVGPYEEIHDRPMRMETLPPEFDAETTAKLEKLAEHRQKLEAKFESLADDDEKAIAAIEAKAEALDAEMQEIEQAAPVVYSDATRSIGTVLLILCPDGQVQRDYRIPRPNRTGAVNGAGGGSGDEGSTEGQPPTSDDLNERQLADLFTHQTLAVREALLKTPSVRKRVLALILHEKVRGQSLAVRHDANAVSLHAGSDGFVSAANERVKEKRAALDPFEEDYSIDEHAGYLRLAELPDARVAQLIDLLTVQLLTAHLQRRTALVQQLSAELKIDLREVWRPDAAWLGGYQKIQLTHLLAELLGPVYNPSRESRKKSQMVEAAARLFAQSAGDVLDDRPLDDKSQAERIRQWRPAMFRDTTDAAGADAVVG